MEKKEGGQGGQDISDGRQGNDEGDLTEGQQLHEHTEVKGFKSGAEKDKGGGDKLEKNSRQMRSAEKRTGRGMLEKTFLDQDESPGFGSETDRHQQENIPEGFFSRNRSGYLADFFQESDLCLVRTSVRVSFVFHRRDMDRLVLFSDRFFQYRKIHPQKEPLDQEPGSVPAGEAVLFRFRQGPGMCGIDRK